MDLLHIVFVLLLFVLILFTSCLENKSIMYFIMILLIILVIQKCVEDNRTEKFYDMHQATNNKGSNNKGSNNKANNNSNTTSNIILLLLEVTRLELL